MNKMQNRSNSSTITIKPTLTRGQTYNSTVVLKNKSQVQITEAIINVVNLLKKCQESGQFNRNFIKLELKHMLIAKVINIIFIRLILTSLVSKVEGLRLRGGATAEEKQQRLNKKRFDKKFWIVVGIIASIIIIALLIYTVLGWHILKKNELIQGLERADDIATRRILGLKKQIRELNSKVAELYSTNRLLDRDLEKNLKDLIKCKQDLDGLSH